MATFVLVLKFVIAILMAGFFAGIVFLLIKSIRLRPKFKVMSALNFAKKSTINNVQYAEIMRYREVMRKKWDKLLERIKFGNERDLRLAIVEADNLIDEILIQHNHPGKDMGERLKSIHPNEIENINDLWEAHKIRNRIAHESDFHISAGEARKVIEIYHKTLKDLLSREVELV